jgi:hypothetical protein
MSRNSEYFMCMANNMYSAIEVVLYKCQLDQINEVSKLILNVYLQVTP